MASMAAKMILGDKINSVKGELGNLTDKPTEEELEQAQLIEEARQEQESERKAKHDKMEAEREKERQRIRDKYGLKKKEEIEKEKAEEAASLAASQSAGRISRDKKSPAEMQAAMEDEDESIVDTVMSYLQPIRDKLGI
ncbi:uncharacterized protein [Apostichopus japonicus]|uniref:uncharacterized protein isoform X2 n=1 Tax=Stichopus japonicus TaxID=307972 RepID=UPI003AB4BC8A